MAMFGVTGRESYDALYGVLNQPADTTALERQQAPGMLQGNLGDAAGTGIYRGLSRGAASLANVSTPFLTPVAKSIDEMFGSSTAEWLQGETDKANRALLDSKLDPKTHGAAAQVLYGLGDVLTTVVSTGGNPYATGALYGLTQAQIGVSEGLDPKTALMKGTIEGAAMGVSVAVPASLSGSLAFRVATGAGINVGIGVPERFAVSELLKARGYPEMARQYAPFDSTSIITELVLGATFGGIFGGRGRAPKLPPPEAIPPSAVDAALTANQAKHAEIDTAPGIPTDTRSRQAHAVALNQAVESLVMGREVSVERILADAGFTGKRPDFDALKVIADELEKAGANDIVAQVRALEAEARARGLVVDQDTIGSVVLSDKPVESRVAGDQIRESRVKIGEDYVPTRLVLVEAQDVQATMMKADNQFRDRTRVASEQQIADIAARLDAQLLMDAPVMDYGAPVLAADGTVIGGNGRAAAINLAYERGTSAGYRDALRAEFGDAVDKFQQPMVVRVLQREVDVQKAAILSNEGGALRMSALEQAKVDAERLGDFRAFEFSEEGDVNLAANMPFIREWVGQMPQNQRSAIMDADGRLSAEGAGRLRNAILYRAYGDSPTLARLVEATDPGSRNIAAALTRAAPAVADAREAIGRGELYPLGLHDDLISAVEKLDALRRTGMSVDDWTKQLDAFGDGMTAEARLLVGFMDRNIRGSRAISEGIFGFYNRLNEAGNPNQGSMFEAAQPSKMEMLTRALDEPAPMYSRTGADRPVIADVPPVGDRALEREWVRSTAEALARYVDQLTGPDNPMFGRDVQHSGSKAGPSSYFKFGTTEIRVSTHSKGAFNSAGYVNVFDKASADNALALIEKSASDFLQKKAQGRNVYLSRGARGVSTVADLTGAFRAMFGRDADRLMETGRVRMVQSVKDLPGGPHPDDVGGMYWKGEAWVVADNTGLSQIRGRVLHEIGEHAGMEQMLGPQLYRQVLDTVVRKAETDPVFREARALAEARANRPEHVDAETLAYLVENAPELPVVRRILAAVRQWLYRTTNGRFVDLNQADLQMMAVASLRRYAREAEIEARGGDAPWYMTLFHGTPNPFKPEADAPLGRLQWRFINTGEGAQAFGYGHYLAQQEWIARTRYRDRLVKRRAKQAQLEIPYPGDPDARFVIDDSTGPGYRFGGSIVHPNMDGELGGIGWAIREIKNTGDAEQVRAWAEADLADDRVKLEAYRKGNINQGSLMRVQRQIEYWEAALRVLDEVTVDGPVQWLVKFQEDYNGRMAEQVSEFKTRADAENYLTKVLDGRGRVEEVMGSVLRSEITEVRPEPPKGALYGKFIPDETWNQMMIWDAPLSAQPENVRAAFAKLGIKDEPMPEWTVRDDGYLELQSGRNTLLIKELKAPRIEKIVSDLGVSFKEVGKGWPAPWELTWRDGSKAYYDTENAITSVLEKDWLQNEYGIDSPSFAVYRNGKLSSTEKTLDEAKKWALEFAEIRDLTGELAYRRLVKTFDDTGVLDPGGELDDFIMMADMEIKSRRAPEGTDPVEFEYTPGSDEMISVILSDLGIPGHRFLDGETRAAGWDSPDARFNVVLYSDGLGRVAWEANGKAGEQPTEWVTANGRARVVKTDDGMNGRFAVKIDGKEVDYELSLEPALRIAEQALDGQLYSRTGDGDKMPEPDPLEDTTLPDARALSAQADAEIATAQELSQGFMPAVECFLRVGE